MTVMLLQHTALQHYKLPAPPRMTKAADPSLRLPPTSTATAMRYYRLWIYTCNAVLLVSVLGFAIVAGRIVVADPRRYLVPGLSLYQPSFLYAYLALATQSGLLQLVGCLGALRLNERLLNVYWLLLLVLLFGDAIVGIVWVFRFDKICADLRPTLKQRLAVEYGVDKDFTALWDALQRDYRCCGVDGAHDFGVVNNRSSPAPVTSSTVASATTTSTATTALLGQADLWDVHPHHQQNSNGPQSVPESCCRFSGTLADGVVGVRKATTALSLRRKNPAPSTSASNVPPPPGVDTDANRVPTDTSLPSSAHPCGDGTTPLFHTTGCEDRLLLWLRQSADILFVLGYCVIAFLKLCFLGILRYEIREMIQKIKILQGDMRPPTLLLTELGGGSGSPRGGGASPTHATTATTTTTANTPPHMQPLLMNHTRAASHEGSNGGIPAGEGGGSVLGGGSLQTTPLHAAVQQRHLSMLNNDGTDSDTNSNCALIISEECAGVGGSGCSTKPSGATRAGSNGNNNYEIHELQELNRLLSRHQTQI